MRVLSNNELEHVNGGFGPLGGGILGGVTYTLGNAMSGGSGNSVVTGSHILDKHK